MRVLIAEDDLVSRRLLEATLVKWGYEVLATATGTSAWETLQQPGAPRLAILDWMMPGLDGVEVCRRVRARSGDEPPYLLLLTAKDTTGDVVAGLEAGADDYLTKPFDSDELHARIRVGMRILKLQTTLAARVHELADALARVKQLHGLLPICAYCKRIRDDGNYWRQVESYIAAHSEAKFSHGICPGCYEMKVLPEIEKLRASQSAAAELATAR